MKNLIVAGVILATLGYLLYRRSTTSTSANDEQSNSILHQHIETLDMENIIEWFMTRQVADFMTPDILTVAVNLKTLTATTEPFSEFKAILSQFPREHGSHPEEILLGFFNKDKGMLIPPPHAVVLTADALTPALRNHFKDKAILILE